MGPTNVCSTALDLGDLRVASWVGLTRSRTCTTMVFMGCSLQILGDQKTQKYPRAIGLI